MVQRSFSLLCALVGLLGLSGCAVVSMSEAEFPRDEALIVLDASQEDVYIEQQVTQGLYGGALERFIGSIVDENANRNAEAAGEALIAYLSDYDVSGMVLDTVDRLKVAEVLAVRPEIRPVHESGAWSEIVHDGDLIALVPYVEFSNDLSTLIVSMWLEEHELKDSGDEMRWAGLRQHYSYGFPLEQHSDRLDRVEYAAIWLEKSREEIREHIREGIDTVVRMVVAHVEEGELPDDSRRARGTVRAYWPEWGQYWKESEGAIWYKWGFRLMALPKEHVLLKE